MTARDRGGPGRRPRSDTFPRSAFACAMASAGFCVVSLGVGFRIGAENLRHYIQGRRPTAVVALIRAILSVGQCTGIKELCGSACLGVFADLTPVTENTANVTLRADLAVSGAYQASGLPAPAATATADGYRDPQRQPPPPERRPNSPSPSSVRNARSLTWSPTQEPMATWSPCAPKTSPTSTSTPRRTLRPHPAQAPTASSWTSGTSVGATRREVQRGRGVRAERHTDRGHREGPRDRGRPRGSRQ